MHLYMGVREGRSSASYKTSLAVPRFLWQVAYLLSSIIFCDGLYMLGSGSGTIRKCGLVGVGVALWTLTVILTS